MTRPSSILVAVFVLVAAACDSDTVAPDALPDSRQRLQTGESTTCALDATSKVWCWGQNSTLIEYGVRGVASSPTPVNTSNSAFSMANGHGQHMCATSVAKSGMCWGRNSHGQLGSATARDTGDTPATLPFGQWIDLSVSRLTTCGVTNEYIAYCWGANQRGEAGNSTRALNEVSNIPYAIESTRDFRAVAAGWLHTCALTNAGEVFCWGDNRQGQLGIGSATIESRRTPAPVSTTLRFEQITAGANYTCAITIEHTAWCWGSNDTGALGDGTTAPRTTPTAVAGNHRFTRIVAASGFGGGTSVPLPPVSQGSIAHTCALTEDGAAYCWGWNGAGQLGNGTFDNSAVPVAVAGARTFTEIAAGGSHSCGRSGSTISCWGSNQVGQLGTGGAVNSPIPVTVAAPFNAQN